MRWLLIGFLLLGVRVAAQEDALAGDAPLLEGLMYLPQSDDLVWVDDDTLWFETFDADAIAPVGYEYQVETGVLRRLPASPFYFEPTPERAKHYQMARSDPERYTSFQSPFGTAAARPILYESRLHVDCGHECGGLLVMAGMHYDEDPIGNYYFPLGFPAHGGLGGVHWGRSGNVAVVERGQVYGCCAALYFVSLSPRQSDYLLGFLTDLDKHVHAISHDGTRVLYTEPDFENSGEQLVIVELHLPTETERWLSEAGRITLPGAPGVYDSFVGANFIAEDTRSILALDVEGIVQIDLPAQERTLINANINAQWVRLGVFSPDNRHVAVITRDSALYVLTTRFE